MSDEFEATEPSQSIHRCDAWMCEHLTLSEIPRVSFARYSADIGGWCETCTRAFAPQHLSCTSTTAKLSSHHTCSHTMRVMPSSPRSNPHAQVSPSTGLYGFFPSKIALWHTPPSDLLTIQHELNDTHLMIPEIWKRVTASSRLTGCWSTVSAMSAKRHPCCIVSWIRSRADSGRRKSFVGNSQSQSRKKLTTFFYCHYLPRATSTSKVYEWGVTFGEPGSGAVTCWNHH